MLQYQSFSQPSFMTGQGTAGVPIANITVIKPLASNPDKPKEPYNPKQSSEDKIVLTSSNLPPARMRKRMVFLDLMITLSNNQVEN